MSEAARELFPEETVEKKQEMPMRWHGFLVKFMLWAAAAWHIFQGYWVLAGRFYYETAIRDAIYAALPALRIVDCALAALLVFASLVLLAARHMLSRRRKKGISCLYAAYILLAAAQAAHVIARFAVSGMPPLNLSAVSQTAAYAALLLTNVLYYRRRAELFE